MLDSKRLYAYVYIRFVGYVENRLRYENTRITAGSTYIKKIIGKLSGDS